MVGENFIFPPAPGRNSPFRLHLAGSSYCDADYRINMREIDFYFVFEYVEKGRGVLSVDGRDYPVEAGDVYIVPNCGKRTYRTDPAAPWTKHWFNVSGPLVTDLLRLYGLEETRVVRKFARPELFTSGLDRLRQHPELAHLPLGPEIIGAIIAQLAADAQAENDVEVPIGDDARLLRDFLEKQLFRPMPGLDAMGKVLSRSNVQTIRIFRRDFGETPYQYLLNRKLAAAQELLQCTRRTVKQISADLCFANEYYFSGVFKRKTGLSPAIYRKQAREQSSRNAG